MLSVDNLPLNRIKYNELFQFKISSDVTKLLHSHDLHPVTDFIHMKFPMSHTK
jgi:hypothetical protein